MDKEELRKFPIITKATIKKIIGCNDDYAYTVLNRLLNSKKIKKVIKGKYTVSDDIYLIATNIFNPCYLSFWACAYFKGYTEQIINTVQIAVTKDIRDFEYDNYKLNYKKLSKKMFFGYQKIKYGDFFIFIAEDEKLLIDSLYYEDWIGNFDEIIKIVQSSDIREDTMVEYLKRIDNKSLNKRIGFLLEKFKGIDLSEKLKYKDKNIISLSKYLKADKINKKWQVKHDL